MNRLANIRTIFLDLDGVVWFGDTLAEGAAAAIDALRSAGLRVCFLSNITSSPPATVASKLTNLGVPAGVSDVQTPFSILERHPFMANGAAVLLLGNEAVQESLNDAGINLTGDANAASVVLLSRDTDMTYMDLALAADALQNGARLLALNLDARVPSEGGRLMPGTGAIAAFLTFATGAEPAAVGKPSGFFFDAALERFSASRSTTVMAGDSLDSDIRGGLDAGLLTVQVGGDSFSMASPVPVPDHRVGSLSELAELLLSASTCRDSRPVR